MNGSDPHSDLLCVAHEQDCDEASWTDEAERLKAIHDYIAEDKPVWGYHRIV